MAYHRCKDWLVREGFIIVPHSTSIGRVKIPLIRPVNCLQLILLYAGVPLQWCTRPTSLKLKGLRFTKMYSCLTSYSV